VAITQQGVHTKWLGAYNGLTFPRLGRSKEEKEKSTHKSDLQGGDLRDGELGAAADGREDGL
jgi:hypothetical protein